MGSRRAWAGVQQEGSETWVGGLHGLRCQPAPRLSPASQDLRTGAPSLPHAPPAPGQLPCPPMSGFWLKLSRDLSATKGSRGAEGLVTCSTTEAPSVQPAHPRTPFGVTSTSGALFLSCATERPHQPGAHSCFHCGEMPMSPVASPPLPRVCHEDRAGAGLPTGQRAAPGPLESDQFGVGSRCFAPPALPWSFVSHRFSLRVKAPRARGQATALRPGSHRPRPGLAPTLPPKGPLFCLWDEPVSRLGAFAQAFPVPMVSLTREQCPHQPHTWPGASPPPADTIFIFSSTVFVTNALCSTGERNSLFPPGSHDQAGGTRVLNSLR